MFEIAFELTSSDDPHSVSWYLLSAGAYWIRLGDKELLRYGEDFVAERPAGSALPYPDYYVARLWEDVLEILPWVREPVPLEIRRHLYSWEEWEDWLERVESWRILPQEQALAETALAWWHRRKLDLGYLIDAPAVWMWSGRHSATIRWSSDQVDDHGCRRWHEPSGEYTLDRGRFDKAIEEFDTMLMSRMASRIDRYRGTADYTMLRRDHEQRQMRCPLAMGQSFRTDWGAVYTAMQQIAGEVGRLPSL